jgi:hypothetical protein
LPLTTLFVALLSLISTPLPVLPEMTLRAAAVVPPMLLPELPTTATPLAPFGSDSELSALVPT